MIRAWIAAFLAGFSGGPVSQAARPPSLIYFQPLDGDTLRLPGGEKIRGVGFDAPEIEASCDGEYQLAMEAQARMALLAKDGLTFERQGTDRYGRTLAVIRTRQGVNVADIMISAGLARPYAGGRRGSWCE